MKLSELIQRLAEEITEKGDYELPENWNITMKYERLEIF